MEENACGYIRDPWMLLCLQFNVLMWPFKESKAALIVKN